MAKCPSLFWVLLISMLIIVIYQCYKVQVFVISKRKWSNGSSIRQELTELNSPVSRKLFLENCSRMHQVIFYNRVPKTGSTTFAHSVYRVAEQNKFTVIGINTTKRKTIMSVRKQQQFVENVTNWNHETPAFYHGHVPYINFQKFGSSLTPIYINIIRQPLSRLVSYYYFLRYGDSPSHQRHRHGDTTTFDECVINKGHDCQPEKLWVQIPYFCGNSAECWNPGSKWALEQAKSNLVNGYVLVGMTERMDEFLVVLEATIPEIFQGISSTFTKQNSHIRRTLHKDMPSNATVNLLKQSPIWKLEQEFYDFAQNEFNFIKSKSTTVDSDGKIKPSTDNFQPGYKKISTPNNPRNLKTRLFS